MPDPSSTLPGNLEQGAGEGKVTDDLMREGYEAQTKVTSCPECGAVTDIEYDPQQGNDDCPVDCEGRAGRVPVNIPLEVQERLFAEGADDASAKVYELNGLPIEPGSELYDLAFSRLRSGFEQYGSEMYVWDAETRRRNVMEELADAIVYLTSGPIE
jgi:hypothetical protein